MIATIIESKIDKITNQINEKSFVPTSPSGTFIPKKEAIIVGILKTIVIQLKTS